jgi:lipopolysaccharide export system protein LptA
MATSGFGQKEARRKKWITGVVVGALGVTALTVGVTYWVGVSRKEQPLPITKNLPTDIHQQFSGYTFTRSDEGRQVFTVHAARTVAFKRGGITVLEDVVVEMFGRAGNRHDILRTRRCDYNPQSGDFFSSGTVQIELNAPGKASPPGRLRGGQPVYLETSKVAFRNEGSTVVSDAPLRFRIGPASGTAQGMSYATREGWLELKSEVELELQPRGGGNPPPPVRLRSSRLRYDKSSAQVRLWGPLEITQGTRRVTAEQGVVYLDPRDRITRADLEGMVKANDSAQGRSVSIGAQRIEGDFDPITGQLSHLLAVDGVEGTSEGKDHLAHLTAQRLEVSFSGAHPRPLSGDVSGKVELTLESPAASPAGDRALSPSAAGTWQEGFRVEKKTLTASEIKFTFRRQERSVQEAETVGPGELLVVPADPKVGERVITAGQLRMAFDERSRLEALRGLAPTRIVFEPPPAVPGSPGGTAQESSADRLEAAFDTATQLLRDVQQSGHFQFRDGDRQARSEEAHYVAPTQSLSLTGRPEIWDPRSRVKCQRVSINLHDDTAEGLGSVQATQLQDPRPAEASTGVQPTHILADRMVAQRSSQIVHYEGNVRAWHGSDVVETSALDVYRTERRLSSGLQVLTSHLQQASPAFGPAAPASSTRPGNTPVTIRADFLEYLDQGRKASYRGKVRMQTETTTLEADRLGVYFSSDSTNEEAKIERALAEGHVAVNQPGRHATGEHAEYFADAGKIVLTGGPPIVDDAEKGSTTGQRLTFFIHDDKLLVDGGDRLPSISKPRVAQ